MKMQMEILSILRRSGVRSPPLPAPAESEAGILGTSYFFRIGIEYGVPQISRIAAMSMPRLIAS